MMWEWKRLRFDHGVLTRRFGLTDLVWLALVCVLIAVAGVHSPAVGVVFWLGLLVNAVILIPGFIIRTLTIGIYVGDRGLKIRNSVRTYVLHWDEIRGVEEGPVNGGARGRHMKAVWIITKQGRGIETQVHRRVGRRSYMSREKIGPVMSESEFAATLEELRGRITRWHETSR